MTKRDPNYVDVHVGHRIRFRRQIIGLSQEKLGELLGITFQQVQKYEKGSNRISASRLYQTARILEVPVQFFFEDLPGTEGQPGLSESGDDSALMASLMSQEGVQLFKAYSEASSTARRKMIAGVARYLATFKD